jgi:hypothetical protein
MARRIFLALVFNVLIVSFAHADPVTWTFYETSCAVLTSSVGFCGNNFSERGPIPTSPPLAVATLTLPGPNSGGSADYDPFGPPPQPVLTGDGNNFSLAFGFPVASDTGLFLNPPTNLGLYPRYEYYDVSWGEFDGELGFVQIIYATGPEGLSGNAGGFNEVGAGFFGLDGGSVGSDGEVGACNIGECNITGYWSSGGSVPEPSSLISMLAALIMLTGIAVRPWRSVMRLDPLKTGEQRERLQREEEIPWSLLHIRMALSGPARR